ncbi:hypothetical protein F8S09_09005 [Deinococcus sp. SDU3-2]|uniref:Uncharacterized protein n=1 Tax=Deinococcus terrestris TaxID=2651870 RepID=A0A7X1NW05_9DEIO|nr:hypothetical protein [Deinococcus terrestris]MPY66826.1 hypothetical protein [Deinococcus terrestris]
MSCERTDSPPPIDPAKVWRWAYGDFLANTGRGVLAEYLVARAVGCTHRPRVQWDAYDLRTDDGLKIEVKSAAYLQAWPQRRPSPIRFDIGLKYGWDAETNVSATEATRSAEMYVFCVFTARERASADPLDLGQWFFLVCSTRRLNARFATQKSVSLTALEGLGLARVPFALLGETIQREAASPPTGLTADG